MRKALIIEPHSSGHRMRYAMRMAKAAVPSGFHVTLVTTPESDGHSVFVDSVDQLGARLTVIRQEFSLEAAAGKIGLLFRQYQYYRYFRQAFKAASSQSKVDIVLVPYLDYCTAVFCVMPRPFDSVPCVAIMMRPAFHFHEVGVAMSKPRNYTVQRLLLRWMLWRDSLTTPVTIDPSLMSFASHNGWLSRRLRYLPDPAEFSSPVERSDARARLGIPSEGPVILVYGALNTRKGIQQLLVAVAENDVSECRVLLAGRQAPELTDALSGGSAAKLRAQGELVELNRFVTTAEELDCFSAADIVWLGYLDHDLMSGVLVQAGRIGRAVIACSTGLIGWLTRSRKLGVSVDVSSRQAIQDAINELLSDKKKRDRFASNGQRAFADHGESQFDKVVCSLILDALDER